MNRFAIVCSFPVSSVSVLYYESELFCLTGKMENALLEQGRHKEASPLARRANIVGYFSLIGLVISWVAQSEVAQYLETHLEYRKPTLITYINHSFSVLLLPLLWIAHVLSTGHWSGLARSLAADGLTGRRAVASVQLGTIYLFGDLLWYIGLAFTSVAAGTAIFNSSCALTFIMSAVVLRTRVSLKSVAAIAFTLGGVVAVSLAPSKSTGGSNSTAAAATATPAAPSPLLGNVIVFAAAACYSVYEVALGAIMRRRGINANSVGVVNGISGCLGLFNLLTCWVAVLAVDHVPASLAWLHERFVWPSREQLGWLMVDGLLALAFNASISMAVAFTSPTLTAACCVLTIPCSALADWALWGRSPPALSVLGGILIMLGFAGLAAEERRLALDAARDSLLRSVLQQDVQPVLPIEFAPTAAQAGTVDMREVETGEIGTSAVEVLGQSAIRSDDARSQTTVDASLR